MTTNRIFRSRLALFFDKRRTAACILLLTAVTVLYLASLITNRYTPGGDGGRIFTSLTLLNTAKSLFPSWNQHILYGYPMLADPENFSWLRLFSDTGSPYFNLQLNLIFVFEAVLGAVATFLFCRNLSFSLPASLLCGLCFLQSGMLLKSIAHGRVNSLLCICLSIVALTFYVRFLKRHRHWNLLASLFISGIVFCLIVQYWLLSVGFFVLLLTFLHAEKTNAKALASIGARITAYGIGSLLAMGFFVFPLLYYQLTNISSYEGLSYNMAFNIYDYLQFFFPLKPGRFNLNHFPFTSLLVFPAWVIAFSVIYSKDRTARLNKRLCVTMGLVLAIPLFQHFLIYDTGNVFNELYGRIPIIDHIRNRYAYVFLFSFPCIILCGYAYDRFDASSKKPLSLVALSVLFFGVPLLLYCIAGGGNLHGFWTRINSNLMLLALLIPLLVAVIGNTTVLRMLFWAVAIASLFIFRPGVVGQAHNAPHPQHAKLLRAITPDDNHMEHILSKANISMDNNELYYASGFSLFFSDAVRTAFSNIYGLDIMAPRPSWMQPPRITKWNLSELNRYNIKYLLQNSDDTAILRGKTLDNWTVAAAKGHKFLLRNEDFRPLFGLHGDYAVAKATHPTTQALVTLDREPQFQTGTPGHADEPDRFKVQEKDLDRLRIKISSSGNAVFVVPMLHADGWEATLDGLPVPIATVNGIFMGVAIPPGRHVLELSFQTRFFYPGLAASLLCIAAVALFCRFRARVEQRHGPA